jgi:hypothetical protein
MTAPDIENPQKVWLIGCSGSGGSLRTVTGIGGGGWVEG